jgi:hypothetical protein
LTESAHCEGCAVVEKNAKNIIHNPGCVGFVQLHQRASSHAQASAPPDGEHAPPSLRIPDGSRPTRYQLTLTVVPGE